MGPGHGQAHIGLGRGFALLAAVGEEEDARRHALHQAQPRVEAAALLIRPRGQRRIARLRRGDVGPDDGLPSAAGHADGLAAHILIGQIDIGQMNQVQRTSQVQVACFPQMRQQVREEAQRPPRQLELGAAAPALVKHLDDAGMEGVGLAQQQLVIGFAGDLGQQIAPLLTTIEVRVGGRCVRRRARVHVLEEPRANDVVDLGPFDGRARVFQAAQDVLQLRQREGGLILGEHLQLL